jgi:hypothetical protein
MSETSLARFPWGQGIPGPVVSRAAVPHSGSP